MVSKKKLIKKKKIQKCILKNIFKLLNNNFKNNNRIKKIKKIIILKT